MQYTNACRLIVLMLTVCLFMASAQPKLTDAQAKDLQEKVKGMCAEEIKLTADEMKLTVGSALLSSEAKNVTANLQCFVTCFYKRLAFLDASGKLKQDVILTYLDHTVKDKTKVKPTWEKCSVIKTTDGTDNGANNCEYAYLAEKCIRENSA